MPRDLVCPTPHLPRKKETTQKIAMPKHTITQEPTDGLIPGASKAWMSHFSPSSNGRIIRVRLNDNNYLAYHPELLCRLTEWHNLYGGACQHGNSDTRYTKWPCAGCRGWVTQNSDRALNKALDNPNRKIAMVPGLVWRDPNETQKTWGWPVASKSGYPKSKMGKKEGEEEVARNRPGENFPEEQQTEMPEEKVYKKKRTPPGKKPLGKDLNHLKFAHHNLPGKDDPVENGRDIAFSGDALPSDGGWQRAVSTGSGVTLGTTEEKELADLRKQGLLKDSGDDGTLTLELIVRDDHPVYTLRLVQKKKKKKKGGKGKAVASVGQISSENSEQLADATNESADDKTGDNVPKTLELLSQEAIEAMPEHCWNDFLADMDAEGWVPVVEDDLASVAESWVVMESGSEDSDEKT